MTTADCPRCSEQVSVPDDASHEATVRCPFCREEYSLGEALAKLPPSLIVVSDFGEIPGTVEADEEGSPWAALNLDDDDADEVALAPLNDASSAAFNFTSGSATTSSRPTAAVRPNGRDRSRKPKGSPIKSILSIVIGGLMAFPIAQLILWYLPGDWKRDFGAGPIVAKYFEVIVPEKFRGNRAGAESNSEPATQASGSVIPNFEPGGRGQFAGTGTSDIWGNTSEDTQKGDIPRKKKQKASDAVISIEEPTAEQEMSLEDAAAVGADVFGSPLEVPGLELEGLPLFDEPVTPTKLRDVITKARGESASPPPALDDTLLAPDVFTPDVFEPEVSGLAPGQIRNAPQVGADDVVECFQAALNGSQAWDAEESGSPSGPLKQAFYVSFSKLGEALTFADQSDENVATQISETAELLHEVGKHSDKLAAIEAAGGVWITWSHERRKTNGVCLSGQVKSVESIGDFFETTVECAGQQIAVVSTSDPSEYFAADQRVLILGALLDDPAKNLGGYEGSRQLVVLDGFHVKVSPK